MCSGCHIDMQCSFKKTALLWLGFNQNLCGFIMFFTPQILKFVTKPSTIQNLSESLCSTVRKKGEFTSVEHAADIERSTYNVELRSNLKNARTCHSMMNDKFKQESGHKKKREKERIYTS